MSTETATPSVATREQVAEYDRWTEEYQQAQAAWRAADRRLAAARTAKSAVLEAIAVHGPYAVGSAYTPEGRHRYVVVDTRDGKALPGGTIQSAPQARDAQALNREWAHAQVEARRAQDGGAP